MQKEVSPIKRKRPPTLVHVARLAGVGIGTASRVLNGDGYVSEKTTARVQAVIDDLKYRPNEVARSLKVRRSRAIGLVVPSLEDPFTATCVQAAQSVIRANGALSVLTFSEGKNEMEIQEIDYLVRRQVDGILMIPRGTQYKQLMPALNQQIPFVAFDQPVPGGKVDSILVKNKAGAMEAVTHLLKHGHKHIIATNVDSPYTIVQRAAGYEEVMKNAGLTPVVAISQPSQQAVLEHLELWMKRKHPPTAIFSMNGLTSIYLLRALAQLKIKVPEQMAIVGFDDLPFADLLANPLTVVRQPAAQLGARAAELLFERIATDTGYTSKRVTLDVEFVIRNSCGCKET
jgi:LacI family transcriptional regulator